MRYRIATREDFQACEECVASTGIYPPVNFEDIGGIILAAFDEDNIVGVVWVMLSNKLAYQDYLAIRPEYQKAGIGFRLCVKMASIVYSLGVTQVWYAFKPNNEEIARFTKKFGAATDKNYTMGCILLGE